MSDATLEKDPEPSTLKIFIKYFGIIMSVVEIIAAISFIGFMIWVQMIPVKYEVIISIVLIIVSALIMLSQFYKVHWVGKAIAFLLTIVLVFGDVYIYQAEGAIKSISDGNTKTDVVSVYVLKDDSAYTIEDASDYTFGYHAVLDLSNTESTISSINSSLGTTIDTKSYTDLTELADALYDKEVGAIILNQSYVSSLEDVYPDFDEDTRIIENASYDTELSTTTDTNSLTEPFVIYLSGNDECGDLNQSGRSDVNILIVVNPVTKQILMINTPRDYYVTVDSLTSGTGKDKLTHAGTFGVDASMATLSDLYDNLDINYYVRVNFTGVEEIVDALGGITINSDIAFSTSKDTSDETFTYVVGENEVNGKKALAYCRERYNLPGGDNTRGENQMKVISAIIDKVASPSILYNYSNVLASVSSMFQTNLSEDDIANMVKLTMDTSTSWNVQSYAVSGTGDYGSSHFFGYSSMYITIPDMSTVDTAITLMNKIKNGEVFDVDEYLNSVGE